MLSPIGLTIYNLIQAFTHLTSYLVLKAVTLNYLSSTPNYEIKTEPHLMLQTISGKKDLVLYTFILFFLRTIANGHFIISLQLYFIPTIKLLRLNKLNNI